MKKVILFLIQLIIFSTVYSQENESNEYEALKLDYKILKIETTENCYLISVIDSADHKYTIISLLTDIENGTKIEINKTYSFQLYILKNPPRDVYGNYIIGGIYDFDLTIDGVSIKIKGDSDTGVVVTTPNLKGLYYIHEQ